MKAQFVDRLAPQAEWRLVHRVADASTPAVVRALGRALVLPETDTTWTRVMEHLRNGDGNAAVQAVDLEPLAQALQDKVWPLIMAAYERAGQVVARQARQREFLAKNVTIRLRPKPTARIVTAFNVTNPHAREWAEQHAAKLVTEITTSTRKALRAVVSEAFRNQVTVRETAKRIRLAVGLTEQQAKAVEKLRARMQDAGEAAATVERRVEFAAARALRERAETIARTEVMGASNAGQLEAWRQGQSDGLIDPVLVKEWIVSPDDRLCPECEPLDGVQVGINEMFPGGVLNPPLHPNCRCASGLVPSSSERAGVGPGGTIGGDQPAVETVGAFETAHNFVTESEFENAATGRLPTALNLGIRGAAKPKYVELQIEQSLESGTNELADAIGRQSVDEMRRIVQDSRFLTNESRQVFFGIDSKAIVNGEIRSLGARYTALTEERALRYAAGNQNGIVVELRIPKGTRAVFARVAELDEIVLMPGSRFKIAPSLSGSGKVTAKLIDDGTSFVESVIANIDKIDRAIAK